MDKFELFSYKDADKILDEKGLFEEVRTILGNIRRVGHREIQAEFYNKGWELEKQIFPEASWAWDAFKDKVAVSVELSLIDAVHRDFLRAILAHRRNDLDALVYVTSTSREPKFHNVRRDLEIFKEILDFPMLLCGITESGLRHGKRADPELQKFLVEVARSKERGRKPTKRRRLPPAIDYV